MTGELAQYIRRCEAQITLVANGRTFVPRELRDSCRVFSIARPFRLVTSTEDVQEMLLAAPGLYEALLRAYHSLLTQRANQLWWQRVDKSDDPSWPANVRSAIIEVANRLGVDAKALANELDDGEYSRTRNLVLLIAERNALACHS